MQTVYVQVVSAPTGSGKTVVMELAILRMVRKYIQADGSFNHEPGTTKAIYIAPSKALIQERVADWSRRFSCIGLNVVECTGDTQSANEAYNLQQADIIALTPYALLANSNCDVSSEYHSLAGLNEC